MEITNRINNLLTCGSSYYAGKLTGESLNLNIQLENQTSFFLDLWIYPNSDSYNLISVGDVVIYIQDDKICMKKGDELISSVVFLPDIKIISNAWNNIFINFDTKSTKIYLQGYLYCSFECEFSTTLLPNCMLCENLNGYIRSVRFYSKLQNDITLRNYIYKTNYAAQSMPEVILWLDFNSFQPKELTGKIDITTNSTINLEIKKVSHGLKVHGENYAFAYAFDNVNFDEGISLHFRIFPKFSILEKQILFTNGENYHLFLKPNDQNIGLDLYCEFNDKVYALAKGKIHIDNWNDILLTTNAYGSAKVFINYQTEDTAPDFQYIGFKNIEYMKFCSGYDKIAERNFPFEGYLSSLAVFNKYINDQDALKLFQEGVFLYESGLVALYSFENGIAVDLCCLKEIKANEEDIVLFEVNDESLNSGLILSGSNFKKATYPDNNLLEPSIVLEPILKFYEKNYGIIPDDNALTYLKQYISLWLMSQEVVKKILTKNKINILDVSDLLKIFNDKMLNYLFKAGILQSCDNQNDSQIVAVQSSLKALASISGIINENNTDIQFLLDSLNEVREHYKVDIVNNNQAYDVLRIDNDYCNDSYVTIKNFDTSVSMNGSFTIDLWFYPESEYYHLISQNNSFDVKIEENKISFVYYDKNKIKEIVFNTQISINKNSWNNFAVSYDNDILYFYIQGVAVYSAKIGSKKILQNTDFKVGRGLIGYVHSLNFYPYFLNENDLKKCIYQYEFQENKVNIIASGNCSIENITHVLNAKSESYASIENPDVNPGGLGFEKFSIFAKFFSMPFAQGKGVIISNGSFCENESVILYLDHSLYTNISYISLKIGEQSYIFDNIAVYNNCWNDVLVSFSNNTIPDLYLNGQKLNCQESEVAVCNRIECGKVIIGNCQSKVLPSYDSYSFNGYISSVAIFNKLLLKSDAQSFHINSPFLYEDGLKALYSFENGIPIEMVSQKIINGINFDDIKIVFGTNDNDNTKITSDYKYRINLEGQITDQQTLLKRFIILQIISTCLKELYDIKLDDELIENLKLYSTFDTFDKEPLNNLIYDKVINANHITDILKQTSLNFWVLLFKNLKGTASNKMLTNKAVALQNTLIKAQYSVDKIVKIVNEIKSKINLNLPVLEILSLTFQHNPSDLTSSATYCRTLQAVITGPEWEKNEQYTKPVLYVYDKLENIKIDICVDLTLPEGSLETEIPVNIYLSNTTENMFSGEIKSEYLLNSGVNNIVFTIPKESFSITSIDKILKNLVNFKISFSCKGLEKTNIQELSLAIYTIPTTPSSPIYIRENNEENLPIIDCIDFILDPILGSYSETTEPDPITDLLNRIHSNRSLKFNPYLEKNDMNKFTTLSHELIPEDETQPHLITDVIKFDLIKFFEEYKKAGSYLKVDSEVYALFLMYAFCLLGKQAVVSYIISGNIADPFITNAVHGAKENSFWLTGNNKVVIPNMYALNHHAVVECNGLIYDASFRKVKKFGGDGTIAIYQEAGSLPGLYFEKNEYNNETGYINMVFQDNTYAMPGGITNDITVAGFICQITPVQN